LEARRTRICFETFGRAIYGLSLFVLLISVFLFSGGCDEGGGGLNEMESFGIPGEQVDFHGLWVSMENGNVLGYVRFSGDKAGA